MGRGGRKRAEDKMLTKDKNGQSRGKEDRGVATEVEGRKALSRGGEGEGRGQRKAFGGEKDRGQRSREEEE
jgi:hypothetical protein